MTISFFSNSLFSAVSAGIMTVSYSHDLISIKWFTFLRVLCRWRGSIYKLVLPDLGIFLVLFATFSLIYRFALPVWAKE